MQRHTCKNHNWSVVFITTVIILASLPNTSSLSLPSGDPAPGRSPGPPLLEPLNNTFETKEQEQKELLIVESDKEIDTVYATSPIIDTYDETTMNPDVEVTTGVNEVSGVSDKTVSNACAFARISSDDEVIMLSDEDSDVNLTVLHAVFETEELVRGVVYEVRLDSEATNLRDFVLYSVVDNFIRGNFTPTNFSERPCRDQEPIPYFIPKHNQPERSKTRKSYWPKESSKSRISEELKSLEDSLTDFDYRTKSDVSDYRDFGYYFRPRLEFERRNARSVSSERLRSRKSLKFRRNFVPARIVSGPLVERRQVVLKWLLSDSFHVDGDSANVVFRLRYRKTTSAAIYQVYFNKALRLDCALHLRSTRTGRVHSGHLPRIHGCRLIVPTPAPKNALLFELHKLNVPCTNGFIRYAPNTPPLCGKLEQIPQGNRKFLYYATSRTFVIELHGRPMFAATYHLVDYCHDVVLTSKNGSFEVGPTDRLFCSYKIHLPYGSRVALRLQMGTGPMNREVTNKLAHEDHQILCKGMALVLQDGDSRWRHCSQQGDPLRSVQIVSDGNIVRLNISVLVKRSVGSPMWLKVWWMDKPVEEIVGNCDYGWVVSGDFCVSAFREAKQAWRQAEADCVRMGGHLASIMNEKQQHIIDQLLLSTPGAGVDDVYWVGATDAVHEGEFRWSNGLSFTFAHWYPGWRKHTSQPNDDGMSGQDCVEVRREFPPRPAPDAPTFMWNDRGCREHNYYVCERPASNDPYVSTTVQCNETITLTLGHPHATVSSPGFPRPYPDDVTCVTIIRAPPGQLLLLHFEELLTEYEPHCSYDFLEIEELGVANGSDPQDSEWFPPGYRQHEHFSHENEVWEEPEHLLPESDSISAGWWRNSSELPARRLCGDWTGKVKLLRYHSQGPALRLRFRADHSAHFAGYRAKVTIPHAQSCMDSKQVLFKGYCYLFTSHPRASWSTATQVCEGLNMHLTSVHSAEEERFIVTEIRQSSDYSAGSVYWLGARLAGRNTEGFVWSDGSAVMYQGWPPYNDTEDLDDADEKCVGVQWKSSPVPSQPSGLHWVSHKCSATGGYVCKRRLSSEHIVTNQTVEGHSGVLVSPNYPAAYDNELDYWVHVIGPADTRLVFVFDRLDLEPQKDCLYDYIELRDGSGQTARYCGPLASPHWVATANKATLHFHSDYNTQSVGFSLKWRAVEMSGCPSQTFTSKEGAIQSPNYPDFLLPDLDCTFNILAPSGKRIFLNISYFDLGFGVFDKGVPMNITETTNEESLFELQISVGSEVIRPFRDPSVLTDGLFLSESEVLRIRLKTGRNAYGKGFLAYYRSVTDLNTTHTISLQHVRSGRLLALNWPAAAPERTILRTALLAPHHHTLSLAFAGVRLAARGDWPCGEGIGWIEVHDRYTEHNGTLWTLCERDGIIAEGVGGEGGTRGRRGAAAGVVVRSHLHALTVTQCAIGAAVSLDVRFTIHADPEYHKKLLILSDETSLESCYPNPCQHNGRCLGDETKNFCQCSSYFTGLFCLLTACDRSPCAFGNCTLSTTRQGGDGFECSCATGWKGRKCNERIRPCASRPCNNRGACIERDGSFLCQCNPSWKGKRCEAPNPSPKIVSLGTRMLQEPFWLGLIAVFVVLGLVGLVWCAKRHFPEKIEKLLAEEADRCARRTPSPRKKRNNSTPTKKNAAEKKQILQQLISPATANDHSKKITMGELIQMSEKRTLSTVESAPAFMEHGIENKETSFTSEASSPSTSPSMRHISDPKLEKKVTFARLLNKVSAEMSSSSEVDMVNTIAIPMAVIANRGIRAKASSTPPSPGVEVRSPHSTSSNQGSDSMSSLDLTIAHAALKKYSRTPKISSADSILAMFRNFSSSSAAMVSRASSGGVSISSTPSASSPQDDTIDNDDVSIASSIVPSLAPDSPIARPHNTIEIQVLDPLSAHKSSPSGSNFLHPPSILLEVPSSINKCLSPIRELPTPLPTPQPTPLPTPLPSPRMPRAKIIENLKKESTVAYPSLSEDELDEITVENKPDRPTSGLRLKLRQQAFSIDTPTPSTHLTDSPSPSFTHSQDSEREMSSPSPAPTSLCVPVLTIERPSPGSPPPRRTPPHLEFQPPPLITITYNPSEESDEPISPRPPPVAGNMCYLSPFSMSARGERAPSESNLSSSGYSSMASPGPSRCGSSNPLCPSEMEDPGSGGGPSCFQSRRRPLMKTNSSPAATNEEQNEKRRGRSDSETLSDDPLLESNDEGIGTDERVDDVPSSAKEMETLVVLKETLELPQAKLCVPSGVTKCSIVKCISVERGLDEKASLKPPFLDCSRPLSPVSSRSESPLSDKTGLGKFSPQFYGKQLLFTDSDGLHEFPSSECVRENNNKLTSAQRKGGKKRDRKSTRTASHEVAGTAKSALPHMPHSMHNLLEVPGSRDPAATARGRKLGRRRSRSQAPTVIVSSSSSEDSVSNASVASVASAREFRVPDLELQDTSSKISSSLDLTEDSRKPAKINKLRTISNQIRFLRRLERSLKMKESYPVLSDDEGDESSSVTSPLLQGRKDLNRTPSHAISAPLLGAARPKIARQRRYDRSFLGEDTRTLKSVAGNENSD